MKRQSTKVQAALLNFNRDLTGVHAPNIDSDILMSLPEHRHQR
jgi:hypothetical protein